MTTTPPAGTAVPWCRRDGARRVARTFVIAFLGLAIPGLLGWLADLTEWARAEGQTPFPDAGSLAYLGVTAIAAGFIAVLNAVVIGVEDATGRGVLRTPPTAGQRRNEVGAVAFDFRALWITVAIVGVLLVVWAIL